ncbi:MAG: AAA family ATPase [Planctomycetes bacterium]|nr:AAA family ATPase [Planctomycetota bacterium]MBM4370824.1 IS21-like element helper ATPase IstB [Deltaproteobacteria bacterium]
MDSAERTTTLTPDALRGLGLWRLAEELDDFIARATRARWSPTQTLEDVVRLEVAERARRSVERRLTAARLGRFKPMADFDWDWPKRIDRDAVQRILSLRFLESAENVVLVAAQGLGKTMIAKNLVHAAVMAGHTALFITASDLLLDLSKQDTVRSLERRLAHYARPTLLAVDEVGYLSYDNRAADLLFQVVSRRYEHRSMVLTTNLPFRDWNTVFPNAACATALIDRLTHHAEILAIDGHSYRKREAEQTRKERHRDL